MTPVINAMGIHNLTQDELLKEIYQLHDINIELINTLERKINKEIEIKVEEASKIAFSHGYDEGEEEGRTQAFQESLKAIELLQHDKLIIE